MVINYRNKFPIFITNKNYLVSMAGPMDKKEKEKQKRQHKKEKEERKEVRKANSKKGAGLDEMMAYLDENGNISSTPPDPTKKVEINAEDISLGPSRYVAEEQEVGRTGIVTFFNETKGFGFLRDLKTQESIFLHINQLSGPVKEGEKLSFEVERGPKGLSAVNVSKVK
jgi:cold shock CspA family protein